MNHSASTPIPPELAKAAQKLQDDPKAVARAARAFLATAPDHPEGRLLLASAQRLNGEAEAALAILNPLAAERPNWAIVQMERGAALEALDNNADAIVAFKRAADLAPALPGVWRGLGDAYYRAGHVDAADKAYGRHVENARHDALLRGAIEALENGHAKAAEDAARNRLRFHPTDILAIRLLAEICLHTGRAHEVEDMLAGCVARAPGYHAARFIYANVLGVLDKPRQAMEQIDILLKDNPNTPQFRSFKIAALSRSGDYEGAIAGLDDLLKDHQGSPVLLFRKAGMLRAIGRGDEAVAAFRACIQADPACGEAYWGLADMKTVRFDQADIEAMQKQLTRADLRPLARITLHFALGRAFDRAGRHADAFESYAAGNALKNQQEPYDADLTGALVDRSIAHFTPDWFAARAGQGDPSPAPIFVLGLPRAGSTLVEQILASHSAVEGVDELHIVNQITDRLARKSGGTSFPALLDLLGPQALQTLGAEYLEKAAAYRRSERPFFVDKMPNNFLRIGMIQAMLPGAKIVDVRRHPMACGFSLFAQLFSNGQTFAFNLSDIGRFYRDYVRLMAHYDKALPGRVHRIVYENLIANPEEEIRRLLAYCALPFEESCLRPHESKRAVLTASSEQVRRPINADALDHWRHYEEWLGPLKDALGPLADCYPDLPTDG